MKGDNVVIGIRDIYNLVMESGKHHEFHDKSFASRRLMLFIESLGVAEDDYEDLLNTLEDEAEYQGFVYGFIAAMDLIDVRKCY